MNRFSHRPRTRLIVRTLGTLVISVVLTLTFVRCTARSQPATPATPAATGVATCGLASGTNKIAESPGASILSASDADLARELDTDKQLGMWAVRIDIDWSVVEPVRGQRNWTPIDRVINAVASRGLCPLGLVAYTPIWAARATDLPTNSHFRPASAATFASFAAAAASRYAGSIAVWEIWNEPNLANYWLPRSSASEYGTLLDAAATAIKSVVPTAGIVSGGLGPGTDNGRDIAPLTFVRQLYAGGHTKKFDALGVHPYCYPALPSDTSSSSWNTAQKLAPIHDVMTSNGDGAKPIWMTEFGAPTGTAANAVSEAVQAQSYQILIQWQHNTSWLGPLFAYSLRDAGTDQSDIEQNFGVMHRDWTPKEAYSVLQSAS